MRRRAAGCQPSEHSELARRVDTLPLAGMTLPFHKPHTCPGEQREQHKDQPESDKIGTRIVRPACHSLGSRRDLSGDPAVESVLNSQSLRITQEPIANVSKDQDGICSSVSGTASLDASNHSSLNTMRFLCFIARFAVSAIIASAMATRPLQRSSCQPLPLRMQ